MSEAILPQPSWKDVMCAKKPLMGLFCRPVAYVEEEQPTQYAKERRCCKRGRLLTKVILGKLLSKYK